MKKIEKLRTKLLEMTRYEKELYDKKIEFIGGVDEVGRGCIAGPVVASCVVLPKDWDILGLDDSKKMSEKKREEMYDIIVENAIGYSVSMIWQEEVDEINILNATKKAMKMAINDLKDKMVSKGMKLEYLLIDALTLDDVKVNQQGIIKGDANSISIAAASIVAKVTRDRLMVELSKKYPDYAFDRHKGYGTKLHYEKIDEFGVCELHRKTFLKKYYEHK